MPSPFPINPSAIPVVATRKALLIIDLQNDFLCPEGALPVVEPEGFVDRTLELAKAFRDSGAGDVIWVRTEFEHHRSLSGDGDRIITKDPAAHPPRPAPSRGRQPASTLHDGAVMESDEEAFLSVGADSDKKPCVRKGTCGALFPHDVQAAVDARRDIVFTKTHYSAFASAQQQLVQLLRGRFVTQMYVCGALTNVSIYATALDAGKHGYDMTIVEDCCGYRKAMRHFNAMRQLGQLTGSEVISFDALLEQLRPPVPPSQSTGLSPSVSQMKLGLGPGSPRHPPASAPRLTPPGANTSPQPGRDRRNKPPAPPRRAASKQGDLDVPTDSKRPLEDTDPLSAESEPSSPGVEPPRNRRKKLTEEQGNAPASPADRSKLASSKGPTNAPGPAGVEAEKPRVRTKAKQRVSSSNSNKKASSSPPPPSPKSPNLSAPSPPDRNEGGATAGESEAKKPETAAEQAQKSNSKSARNMADQQPTPVCSEPLCEGDTTVITNVLPSALAADAFERLLEEASWAGMSHLGGEVPRRIAVQGAVGDDGSVPVYRHPADESPPLLPFSPTVLQIKEVIEKHLGHPLNHVLIQHYRSGNDYISEHSDKTLDIVKGSFIANVSLGAERTMVFRTKRPPKDKKGDAGPDQSQNQHDQNLSDADKAKRQVQRAALPHNSLCRMGLATNERWLHAIRQDKRSDRDKAPAELSHGGARISLTFRQIGTFIADDGQSAARIWGQGATSKTKEGARPVINGQTPDAVRMLQAFGAENHASAFDWDAHYGAGFDVLHMGTPKRFCAAAATAGGGSCAVANARVALALAELGVSCAKGSVEGDVRFEDNDPARTVVDGHATVLRYLDAVYGPGRRYDQLLPGEVGKRFTRLQRGLDLLDKWRAALKEAGIAEAGGDGRASGGQTKTVVKLLGRELADWEGWAKEAAADAAAAVTTTTTTTTTADDNSTDAKQQQRQQSSAFYIVGGSQPSPADFALWPVLHDIVRVCGEQVLGEHLRQYYAVFKERSAAVKALSLFKQE
ncbi:Alpha-ketoglutarate-dependent dioxygenase alkB 2 [Madurella mycetomatis]|uniref:Alpha-ketoglutarate-dependent dioxygenase alkB 2 n=1 Tax=Madurella mycetomatis TaxID=100816 RepID=A0A175WCM1_9PEZI|nr:Alpha-ketoglutarate-dependent dioxygenase alkB 2 [Madurella mycetomatis]